MKKQITIGILALGLLAMSFKMAVDKTNATVSSIEGINVFSYSKPTASYDVIGTVKIPGIISDRSDKRLKSLINRAKEDFPSASAIILNDEFGKAEVIKFKD